MNKFEELTFRGAQAIEAAANGIDHIRLGDLIYLSADTVKTNIRIAANILGVHGYRSRIRRMMSVAIANDVLQEKDLKAPGKVFSFTMNGQYASRGVSMAAGQHTMPKGKDRPIGTQSVSPLMRTYLSYLSFGMSIPEMLDDPSFPQPEEGFLGGKVKGDLGRERKRLGFLDTSQMIAHAAVSGIIDIPPDIPFCTLGTDDDVRPPIYYEAIDWAIDRPSYRPAA
ncbi:MAG: hypothetical protein ABWX94_02550 [Candidatus Saccharimonadales bacterium]